MVQQAAANKWELAETQRGEAGGGEREMWSSGTAWPPTLNTLKHSLMGESEAPTLTFPSVKLFCYDDQELTQEQKHTQTGL